MKTMIHMLVFVLSLASWAQNDSIFNIANEAYADGNYQEAQRLYQSILKADEMSGELYFNLGNTHYKLENLAQSIYYYEKALKFNPQDEAILNNLNFAERMRLDQFERLPESEVDQGLDSFITFFSVDTWSIVGIGLLFISALAFGVFLFFKRPFLKRLAFGFSLGFILLSVGAFSMAQTQVQQINNTSYAIIFEEEKILYEEPNPNSSILLNLHEGTKIKILDEFRSFYKVELPDGTTGWMDVEGLREI